MKKILILGAISALLICGFTSSAKANEKQVATTTQLCPVQTNWDLVLDQYEKCIDKYLTAYKKLQAGDTTQAATIEKLSAELQKLSQQLAKAGGKLTDAQNKRLVNLGKKLAGALTVQLDR